MVHLDVSFSQLGKAKELVKAIVALGQNVITQRLYQYLGDFYYVVLKPGGDTARFLRAHALTKLALFVADALREGNTRQRNEPKPLLIAAPNPERGTHCERSPFEICPIGS